MRFWCKHVIKDGSYEGVQPPTPWKKMEGKIGKVKVAMTPRERVRREGGVGPKRGIGGISN